jgi:class 3 adenylate cyclase/predicted ATPase
MTFDEILDQAIEILQRRGRVSYRALKAQFHLDDDLLETLKEELIEVHQLAIDQDGKMLVWTSDAATTPEPPPLASVPSSAQATDQKPPISYTPQYLTEKILTSRSALEGERKVVTVLFADIKDSTELIKDLDPEDAQKLLDPAIHIMMDAVHKFEGTVNQVLGDGIMALFGAPIAHEDHAARSCYAALAMQTAMRDYTEEVRRNQGLELRIRVGLNSGEVVVRTIGNDLHMDYSAVGPTTHLAARMEQLATPGSIRLSSSTLRLVEGLVQVNDLGPIPVKGMTDPVEVFELTGASTIRRRLQAAVARGLTKFVGRDTEIETLNQARERAEAGHGQIQAAVGEAGVGKSRLVYEFVHSHRTRGWLVLESASVSYGKATPYFPVLDLLKRYVHVEDDDDPRTIRAKVTGQILTLDESLQETIPPLLSLLDALPEDSPFLQLDPPQRRQRTLDGLKRILLRESQVQPLLLVFEDMHWIDSETQALLDSLIESLPTAQLLLLVNYRPEYQHSWGGKTSYTQLRLDPLQPENADEFLQALLGDDPSLEPLKKLLIERTEGNPFFLEESVRTLVETQVLVGEQGAYRLAQDLPTIQVPPTVQAVLAARIDRLPPEEKRLLQTAAVIGMEVPFALLRAMAEVSEEVLHRGLTHLQATEFLYETRLFPDREYTFKHALTQNVAYQSLLTTTRQQVHQRIAQALVNDFPERVDTQPELLAHHYTEAGLHAKAVGYWQRAGQRAIERSAHAEAMAHLNTGLEVLATLPESPERTQRELDLQIALGPVLTATKGYGAPEVERVYTRARQLCEQVEETAQRFSALMGLFLFYFGRGELHTARTLGVEALTLAQRLHDPSLLVVADWLQGFILACLGEFALARERLEHGIALYDPEQDRHLAFRYEIDPGVGCLMWIAVVLWLLGYADQALQRIHEALTLAQELPHPYMRAYALLNAAILHRLRREASAVQERTEANIAISTEQGFAYSLARSTSLRGWALAEQEATEQGLAQVRQGLAAAQALGTKTIRAFWLSLLIETAGEAGQVDEGLETVAEALEVVGATGERLAEAELHRLKGELLLARSSDNHTEAETCFHQALSVAQSQQAKSLELRAATSLTRLWQSQDKRKEAYDLLAPVYNWFTEGFSTKDLQDAKALIDELS